MVWVTQVVTHIVCVNNKTLKRMVSIFIIKHQLPKGTWVQSTCKGVLKIAVCL